MVLDDSRCIGFKVRNNIKALMASIVLYFENSMFFRMNTHQYIGRKFDYMLYTFFQCCIASFETETNLNHLFYLNRATILKKNSLSNAFVFNVNFSSVRPAS